MKFRTGAALTFPLLLALACSSQSSSDPGVVYGTPNGPAAPAPGTGTGGLNASTVAVKAADASDIEVQADRIIVTAGTHGDLTSAKPGAILISERGSLAGTKNTEGFLRKVVSVIAVDGKTTIMTEQATLLDAFDTLSFQATLTTPALTLTGPQSAGLANVHTQDVGNGTPITVLDASGTKLLDKTAQVDLNAGKTIGVHTQVTLPTAKVVFTPSWDVGMQLGALSLDIKKAVKEAHVVGKGQLDAELQVLAGLELVGDATGDDLAALISKKVFQKQDKTIADYDVSLGSISLGPLSAPASAHFSATLSCEMNWGGPVNVTVGGKASGEIQAGFKYENQKVTPVFKSGATMNYTGPAFTVGGAARVLCTIEPKFDLKLFGVASADIWADPYVTLGAEATCGGAAPATLTGDVTGYAQAGVSASASVKVDVFGLFKKELACKLFDVQSPLAEATGKIPLGAGSTCTAIPLPARPALQANPLPGCFENDSANGKPGSSGPTTGTDGGASGGACHDVCTPGEKLATTCTTDGQNGACIQAICQNDAYCCDTLWGPSCTGHIEAGDFGCTKRACN